MKYPAWLENVGRAKGINGTSPSRTPRKYGETRSLHSRSSNKSSWGLDKEEDRPLTPPTPSLPVAMFFKTDRGAESPEARPPTPPSSQDVVSLIARPRPVAPDHTEKNRFSRGDFSTENFPLPTRTRSQAFDPNKRFTQSKSRKSDSIDKTLAAEYSSFSNYVQTGVVPTTGRPLRRRNRSSTSTIFQNSPLAPVTIIVTTPEDEALPSPPLDAPVLTFGSSSHIHAARQATNASFMSLPTTVEEVPTPPPSPPATQISFPPLADAPPSSSRYLVPDDSRLRPPTEKQIDARRLRKAQEYREMRKFIISIMNTKADQFPPSLRARLMEGYSISDSDLDPRIVSRFPDENNRDEGVVMVDGETWSDADDLDFLKMMFRSQLPVVAPALPQSHTAPVSAFRSIRGPDGQNILISKRSTSIAESRHLGRTSSEPNLHKLQQLETPPPMPSLPKKKKSLGALNLVGESRRSDSLSSTGISSDRSLKSTGSEVKSGKGLWAWFGKKYRN